MTLLRITPLGSTPPGSAPRPAMQDLEIEAYMRMLLRAVGQPPETAWFGEALVYPLDPDEPGLFRVQLSPYTTERVRHQPSLKQLVLVHLANSAEATDYVLLVEQAIDSFRGWDAVALRSLGL